MKLLMGLDIGTTALKAAVAGMVRVKARTEPDPARKAVYDDGYAMYRKLFEDLSDCFDESL